MPRPKGSKNIFKKILKKEDFKLSKLAIRLIRRLHEVLVKEVTSWDKKANKPRKAKA